MYIQAKNFRFFFVFFGRALIKAIYYRPGRNKGRSPLINTFSKCSAGDFLNRDWKAEEKNLIVWKTNCSYLFRTPWLGCSEMEFRGNVFWRRSNYHKGLRQSIVRRYINAEEHSSYFVRICITETMRIWNIVVLLVVTMSSGGRNQLPIRLIFSLGR